VEQTATKKKQFFYFLTKSYNFENPVAIVISNQSQIFAVQEWTHSLLFHMQFHLDHYICKEDSRYETSSQDFGLKLKS